MGINENFKAIRTLLIILVIWNIILTAMILIGNMVAISQSTNSLPSKSTIQTPVEMATDLPILEELDERVSDIEDRIEQEYLMEIQD